MRGKIWIIGLFLLGIAFFTYVFIQKSQHSAQNLREEEIVRIAMEEPLLAFQGKREMKAIYVKQAKSFYFLALFSYKNEDRVDVREKVLQHVRSLISGGKEPNANGGLEGRTHNIVAQTLVLVKHNKKIWEELRTEERDKVDLIMRSLAIAAHWSYDDGNNFYTGLNQQGNFKKSYNPNYTNGYGNVLSAVTIYFGVEETKDIFKEFSYEEYLYKFKKYGYRNIQDSWSKTGKNLMERGGKDRKGGYGKGVRNEFTYKGIHIEGIMGIFREITMNTYSEPVKSEGAEGKAYILKGNSPVEGELGMLKEFDSYDAKGKRSDAFYAYESWMNTIPTMMNLQLLNYWKDESGEVEKRIDIGTRDLLYKLENGYKGVANGEQYVITELEVKKEGFTYDKFIWRYWLQGK
ncbi:hypothetical protein COI93_01520 [Bacillus cereus]|uniref:Uncharacterized protein n=1 Tax=Bacillus cereus TaxID=1396 RepID=A0A2B0MT75_BACCE|nr:hypothetical protein COI93_01520 [Bacillus cereus]